MRHKSRATISKRFLGIGILVLVSVLFCLKPVYAGTGYSFVLSPVWGSEGLAENERYVTVLDSEDNAPGVQNGEIRTLAYGEATVPYEFYFEEPGDYWYTLTVQRESSGSNIAVYYLHIRAMYGTEGALTTSGTLHLGSRMADKTEFVPKDRPDQPVNPTPTVTPSGTPLPSVTPEEKPGKKPSPSATPTPGRKITQTPGPKKTVLVTKGGTTSPSIKQRQASVVGTGDRERIIPYVILIAVSGIVIAVAAKKMRKNG